MMVEPDDGVDTATAYREFEVDGAVWLAEITGRCVVGGVYGPAVLESIHFRCRDDPAPAVRLAYLLRGAFPGLQDCELRTLHRSAPPLAPRPEPVDGAKRRPVDGTR